MKSGSWLFGLTLLVISCKKEVVSEGAPSLVGNWRHYSSSTESHIIYIQENGEGYMEWYKDGKLYDDTKVRTWYLKNNTIYFGKVALNGQLYEVVDFPSISLTETIHLFDTLKAGERFMKTEDGYYVEID